MDIVIASLLSAHTTKCPNPVDRSGISHFHIASTKKTCLTSLQLFLEQGVDVNQSVPLSSGDFGGYTALHFAIENDCLETVRLLTENGADINKKAKGGQTPLHFAVQSSEMQMIQILLTNNADINIKDDDGYTPLHRALYANKSNMLKLLLEFCSKIDNPGISHFHIACSKKDVGIVESFVNNRVPINSRVHLRKSSWFGFTALYFAIAYNQKHIVELLLQNNANINSESFIEMTALN